MTAELSTTCVDPLTEVEALGVIIEMRTSADTAVGVRERVSAAWKDCRQGQVLPTMRRILELPSAMFDDFERGLSDLSTRVTLEALDALRGTRLLLHAAGVATDDGRVLAMVGPSGRGKTTASLHLGTHFAYVSDETVAVADDLAVTAYRKPLSVITEGHVHKQQVSPSELGLRPLPEAPLRAVGLTLIDRDPDADEIGPVAIDTIDAICEMTPQISYLPDLPSPLQHLARLFDAVGAPTRLTYRDATELPSLVATMFDSPAVPAPSWEPAPPALSTGPWRAVDVDDAILVDGRACILLDGVVTALDHRGRLAWMGARRGATTAEIAQAAVAEFGAPGDGAAVDLIEATLQELCAYGLIEAA